MNSTYYTPINRGIIEAKNGNTMAGLLQLEPNIRQSRNPEALAWFGLCLATERADHDMGTRYCRKAVELSPKNPNIYLALGRLYLMTADKKQAIEAFNKGLKVGRNVEIRQELEQLGVRSPPLFTFFNRKNPLNVFSGRLLRKFNLR